MKIAVVTGSAGLIGSETCQFFHSKGFKVIGIDNDMRSYFFGEDASTNWIKNKLELELDRYTHYSIDIRDAKAVDNIFKKYLNDISIVVHTAAQPSHDWAAKEPVTDFTINANGTLNMLESTRKFSPDAVFILTSTNKVYGDTPNFLPLVELEERWELSSDHKFFEKGIDETMSIDNSKHSLFGVSKLASDILTQEYGKYFGMKTSVFRGGCLTGPAHSGAELHGFLAYLVQCAVTGKHYNIFGYKGKQVRDNIHSKDLIDAFWQVYLNPRCGEVYNIGGSRHSNVSMLEAIRLIKEIKGYELDYTVLEDQARSGDHMWYVSDIAKFRKHYPNFKYNYDIKKILTEMILVTEEKEVSFSR
jgi:CDP-paratose 2-epimerase|tara:strand:- start:48 stop:1127 length:1080 start_codon:yes stop_codon:yes gene_type:complete